MKTKHQLCTKSENWVPGSSPRGTENPATSHESWIFFFCGQLTLNVRITELSKLIRVHFSSLKGILVLLAHVTAGRIREKVDQI